MYGITYKNKHSYNDFGLTIQSKSMPPPEKQKIKETIPFMNGTYDYSSLYGTQTYSERKIQYVFNLNCIDKIQLGSKKIDTLDWLMNSSSKDFLRDDSFPNYYFKAECETADFVEDGSNAELTINFIAYPFLTKEIPEGDDVWDTFNFDLDYLQNTKFSVTNTLDVTLSNSGIANAIPSIICDSSFQIIKGSTIYNFNAGTTRDWRFYLDIGQNNLTINGNGNIEFVFYREVL